MRLRNRKTGEIIELLAKPSFVKRNNDYFQGEINTFNSLAELNEEWEDVPEEMKVHWCVTMYGGITRIKDDEEPIDDLIEIGNYFNSKEDAYDALYKLKAVKRLKDKGFRFRDWNIAEDGKGITIFANYPSETRADLDICFGGEE